MATKARYEVLNSIKHLEDDGKKDLTTQQIADENGLTRGVVSHYLSQLLKEELVEKFGTKPVYWRLKKIKDPFRAFIGGEGSLKKVIDACKAAVKYPPNGFPLIITGESGVGKSYLAHLIYEYAKAKSVISSEAQLISLNCADYANNPELLSSVLFGFKKGAFTGATEDTAGLVAAADGGFLFLDEIHRLPKENQEKLFTLLDKGTYSPLGSKEVRQVKIRFLFATTESLDDMLLLTFRRRVPMTVTIPNFIARPSEERMALIQHAFITEAKKMNRKISVNNSLIMELLKTPQAGNLGSLNNQIKLLCAKAYAKQAGDDLIIGDKKPAVTFLPTDKITNQNSVAKEIVTAILAELPESESFLDGQFIVAKHLKKAPGDNVSLQVTGYRQVLNDTLISLLWEKYGVKELIPKEILNSCAFFLANVPPVPLREQKAWLQKIKEQYPRAFYLFQQLFSPLKNNASNEQIALVSAMALFLLDYAAIEKIEEVKTLCILISHGKSTASSIQGVVNGLVGNFIFAAFDMPLDSSMPEISQKVQQYIAKLNQRKLPVILLFDMGSLSQMYKQIKQYLDSDLLVINNLSTPLVLDVALQVQQQKSFREIAERANTYHEMIHIQYYEGISQNKNIIVSCMSGVGLSEEIKQIMLDRLQMEKEIITMDYRDLKNSLASHDMGYFEKTDFIITTTDLPYDYQIPILNIYDIMEASGTKRLKELLLATGEKEKTIANLIEGLLEFFTIEGISSRLQFLNPKVVLGEVQGVVAKYQDFFTIVFDAKVKLNLYMHIALMIERMMISSREESVSVQAEEQLDKTKQEFFSISKNIFHPLEMKYNIVIDDYELSLMYELLKYYI